MLIEDQGVESQSLLDFHMPSKFAEQHLFYIEQFGHFLCNEHYYVDRPGMPSYLLCYIESGSLRVKSEGSYNSSDQTSSRNNEKGDLLSAETVAVAGQFVCLDCNTPHCYGAIGTVDFFWFHFSGAASAAYCELINERFGLTIDAESRHHLEDKMRSIIHLPWRQGFSEHHLSVEIHSLLAELADGGRTGGLRFDEQIDTAIQLINRSYREEIRVEKLAAKVHLSVYHFIRMFKRYTNSTPHEYLLNVRLRQAKRLLQTTTLTNEKIAFECGFNSGSHFARAFRKRTGMTPGAFRKEQF